MPSGILNPQTVCVVGNGVVLHLPGLFEELDGLRKKGVKVDGRLLISDRAHLLFDLHKEIDGLREAELAGAGKQIGTTKRGIGPAYSSKATRNGLRVCDLQNMDLFADKLRKLNMDGAKRFGDAYKYDIEADIAKYKELAQTIKPLISDTIDYLNNAYEQGKRILIEGANATMLDLDFGTYPYVTSSNPSIGGIATGLGLAPNKYQALIGVVGSWWGSRLGRQLGAVEGGPAPCQWLAVPLLCAAGAEGHLLHGPSVVPQERSYEACLVCMNPRRPRRTPRAWAAGRTPLRSLAPWRSPCARWAGGFQSTLGASMGLHADSASSCSLRQLESRSWGCAPAATEQGQREGLAQQTNQPTNHLT